MKNEKASDEPGVSGCAKYRQMSQNILATYIFKDLYFSEHSSFEIFEKHQKFDQRNSKFGGMGVSVSERVR